MDAGAPAKQCTVCGSPMAPNDRICTHCGRAHYGGACGACGQPAPTLIRGGTVVCSACGAVRGPLAGVPLEMVGSAHKVGSWVTRFLGWALIAAGIGLGALVGLIVSFFASTLAPPLITGLIIGALGGGAGALTLWASRALGDRGAAKRLEALEQGVLAMATLQRGAVTTVEVAQNLGITLAEADALLTGMSAKGRAQVEVSNAGLLQYAFRDVPGALAGRTQPMGGTGVRIAPGTGPSPQEVAHAEVEREWERMAERRRGGS